jgi:peptide deformylase
MEKIMAQIVTDEKILRTMSSEWNGNIKQLEEIVDKMGEAMEEYEGVGISAIQVGLPYRIFLAGPVDSPELVMNPKILEKSPFTKTDWEGCLSCPNTMVKVKRAKNITLEYTSVRKGEFVKVKRKFTDFDARVVQHELDHLNGFLITDRGKAYRP